MPRKAKRFRFRGIPKQFLPQQAVSSDSLAAIEETESSSVVTASERKLQKSSLCEENIEEEIMDAATRSTGYRLIDLQCLSEAMSKLHMCEDSSIAVIDEGKYRGSSCQLSFQCTKCGTKTNMFTSKRSDRAQDVNVRATLAMSELGLAREAFSRLSCIFGMPSPSSQGNWDVQSKNVSKACETVSQEQYLASGKGLRRLLQEEDDTITDDAIIDVMVSYDGTWHHRGLNSSRGVGVVMSVDTGEILDTAVMSKSCEICERWPGDKKSSEYAQWRERHKAKGECLCNHEGPSSSMETAAAKLIWSRSIAKHKMRYTRIVCDGDNKTLQALNGMKVYEHVTIEKLECLNHIHKRMGTGLRNLVKKSPHVKGGSDGLTVAMIAKLSSYYRNHIIKFTTTSKDPDDIEQAVKKMQINILASLHHSVAQKDPQEQHKYCLDESVDWCAYKMHMNESMSNDDKKKQMKKQLPESFLPHILPLYKRLSDEALLKRCVSGLTQNQNESFHSTIWRRCPKDRYFGAAAVKRAVAMSVLMWNVGGSGLLSIMESLQLPVNVFTRKALILKDQKRKAAAQRSSAVKRRKITNLRESLETSDYVRGGGF